MVSIIIPALNEESYLPRLLESIRAQDYPDYEIIVADNDSRDRTRSVARAHGARVVRGGVPGVARNRGAAAARGEYLLFVDADTVLPEGFISRIMARFQKDFIDICVPWIRPIDGTNPIYNTIFQFSNTFFKLMEVIQPQGLGICILTTKRLHDRIGGFSEKVRVSEDFDYINRASLVGRFRVYPHVYVYHSVRRYKAEGVGSLVQKQFKSGFIYLFTGRAYDTENYEFGTFSRYVRDERNGKRAEPDGAAARQGRLESKRSAERVSPYGAEVKKLLDSFDRQSRRLRHQIEKIEG
ncbi:MAG TPA: glycosyltransferase, partial [Spirochaetia bacterium]|nr:glycosyltransferase [Spirochaetia bacterium]